MAEGRRGPGVVTVVGLLLLAGSVGATAWYVRRPAPVPDPVTTAGDPLDVFCTGRVDSSSPVIPLEPTAPGRVVEIGKGVTEGGVVKAGQEIFRLDDSAAQGRLAQAKAAVEAAQVDLDAATADQQGFPRQVGAKKHLLAAAAARVDAARKVLQQRQEQQTVTGPLALAEREAIEAQIRELVELSKAEEQQLQNLEDREAAGQGTALRVRAAEAKLRAAKADAHLAERAVAECVVTAPSAGTVLRLQAAVGAIVSPGTVVPPVVFAPAGPLVVRAEVDQESLGRVRAGMAAVVQDENRPDGPALTGRVKSVARWVAQRRTFVLEPGEVNDVRTVECVVEFDPPPADPLWIGQRMRVRILRAGDRVPAPPPPAGR